MVLFLHNAVTISLNFLQCQARWTTLQLIISPGKNPLPALSSIKYSTDGDGENFYALDPPNTWNLLPINNRHLQRSGTNLGQENFGQILCHVFQEISVSIWPSYETLWSRVSQTPWTDAFRLYPLSWKRNVSITLVSCRRAMHLMCNHWKKFFPQSQLVSWQTWFWTCTDTIRAKKNWNSHGATLGLAICQISLIISLLGKASEEEVRPDFNELIPRGVAHTGHKYGNTHSVCVEYMMSTHESWISVGGDEIYLNAERFNQQNHAEIVNKLFSEVVDGYPGVPAPMPTRTHVYLWFWLYFHDFLMENAKIVQLTLTKVSWSYIVWTN